MKVGDTVDNRYELLRLLGAGAMGQVFLARDVTNNRQVALKTVNEDLLTGDGLGRFESEFNAIKEIEHPNTVSMYEFNGRYFTMEYIEGSVLDTSKPLPMAEALHIGAEICRALNYIHRKGIVHGDLKPAHVLILRQRATGSGQQAAGNGQRATGSGQRAAGNGQRAAGNGRQGDIPASAHVSDSRLKLIDFGLSRHVGDSGAVAVKEDVKIEGTIEYMAPEQIKGLGKDARSDLYSLGVMLYEMLTGRLPFPGNDFMTIALGHMNATPKAPSRINPDITPELEALILRLLKKNPDGRWQSAEDVGRRFVELMGGKEARETAVLKGRQYLFSPAFVGRTREMAVLNTYLNKARKSSGCCVMLHGAAGTGKRHLLREFRADHLLEEAVFLSGASSQSHGAHAQYYAEILSQAFHVLERLDDRLLSEKVWEWSIVLARIMPKSNPDWYMENLQQVISVEPALMVRNIADVLLAICRYRPLVICVENLQLADRFGCDLLERLARECGEVPLCVVAAYRDETGVRETPFTRMLSRLQKKKEIIDVRLRPMDRKILEQMIGSMMGHSETARALGEEVARITGGNPLFAEEIMKSFADQEIIFRVGSRWQLDREKLEHYNIPNTLEDVILERALALGARHREVVEAAAVLRWSIDFSTLMTLTRMSQLDLYYILGDLVSKGILKEMTRPEGKTYRFSAERIREYFYTRMDMRVKSKHHEQAARIIEARHKDSPDPVLGELIYHYGGCNDNRKLLEYLLKAGEHAERETGMDSALGFYERALNVINEHGGDKRRHVAVLGRIARLNTEMGNFTKARAQFEAGLRNSERESVESLRISRDMGRMYMASGDVERAGECFRYAEKTALKTGADDAELLAAQGEYYLHMDNLKAAEDSLTRARVLAGESEDRETAVNAGALLATALLRRGRTEEGITVLQEGLSTAERSNINRLKLRALSALVRALIYVGRLERADAYMLEAQEVSGLGDGKLNMLDYLVTAGEYYMGRGKLEKAQDALERCLGVAKEIGDKRRVCDAYSLLGLLNIERDDLKRGIELCERGLSIARSINSKYRMGHIAWLLGGAFLKKGEYDTAQEFLGHSRRIFEKIGVEREMSQVFYLLGEVVFRKRELFTARQFLTMAIDRATLQDDWEILAKAYRVLAHVYMEEDDIEQARKCYRESIEIFERHEDVLGLARTCQDFGLFMMEYGGAEGEDAPPVGLEYLERAFDLYRRTGASFLARKAEILLNRFRRRAKSVELENIQTTDVEAIDVDDLRDSIRRRFDEIMDEVVQTDGDDDMSAERTPEKLLEEVQAKINEAQNSMYRELDGMTGQNRQLRRDIEFLMEEKNNLVLLQEVSRTINSELDMSKLISKILDMVIQVLQAERGFLILKDKTGKLVIRTARNIDRDSVKKPEFKVSFSIAKRVVKTGEPILTSNAQEDKRFKDKISVHDLKLKSVLCVPFKLKEKILGAAYVDNRFVSGLFVERDLELLNAFCNQAAVALENASLYQENLEKQETVENLNRRLQQKVDTQEVELAKVKSVLEDSQKQLGLKYDYSKIIGKSRAMQEVLKLLDRIIDTQIPVIIQGESGTGKELIARAIHYNGPNRDKPFAAENVAALPDTLLESELFGYKRGAFTGADHDKKGLFEIASGGTLFLDEVAEMSENMQKKLLRVLQEGEIRPVGGKSYIKVKLRIVSATNKDLKTLMEKGEFREDLYYRLNVVTINLPPLRDRPEDIPLLVDHLLTKVSEETGRARPEVEPDVMSLLERYKWPGNVRELENEVNRLVALSDRVIRKDSLSQNIRLLEEPGYSPDREKAWWRNRSLKDIEREAIIKTLRTTDGNKVEAARILAIDRTTLYNKMRRYSIEE